MTGLTKKQHKTFEWIRKFIQKNGWSPSYTEIARAMGISGPAAYNAVLRLVNRGFLEKQDGAHRGIKIAKEKK